MRPGIDHYPKKLLVAIFSISLLILCFQRTCEKRWNKRRRFLWKATRISRKIQERTKTLWDAQQTSGQPKVWINCVYSILLFTYLVFNHLLSSLLTEQRLIRYSLDNRLAATPFYFLKFWGFSIRKNFMFVFLYYLFMIMTVAYPSFYHTR